MPRHPGPGSKESVTSSRASVPSSHMTFFSSDSEFDAGDVSSGDMSSGAAFDAAMLHGATFDAVVSDATAFDIAAFDATAFDDESGRGAGRDDCARYSRLLTALFDGESSTRDAALARAHLERCARCTQEWLGWMQTRAFLQSAPPPSVPPGLLTRILLFCRLSMLRHAASAQDGRIATSGALQSARIVENELEPITPESPLRAPSGAKNAKSIEADPVESDASPRPLFQNDAAPPAQLRQAILDRTTGAPQSDARRTGSGKRATTSKSSAWRKSQRSAADEYSFGSFSRPARAMHRFAPLAVPAMLGWIAFSTYEPQLTSGVSPVQTTPGIALQPASPTRARSNDIASQKPRAASSAATLDSQHARKPANGAFSINNTPRVAITPPAATAPVPARTVVASSNGAPSVAVAAAAKTPRVVLNRASDSTSAPRANATGDAAARLMSSAPARQTQAEAAPSVRARTAAPRHVDFPAGDAGRQVASRQVASSPGAFSRIFPHAAATREESPRTAATRPNARLAAFRPAGTLRVIPAAIRSSSRPGPQLGPRLAIVRWKASSRLAPALSASPSTPTSPSTRATQGLNLLKVSSHAISERAQTLSWRPATRLAPSSGASDDEDDFAREAADDSRNEGDPQTLRDMMNDYSAALLDDGSDSAVPNAS